MRKKMPGKGRQYTPKELTEKQQLFITCLLDTKSDTFANTVKSLQKAGYKHGRSPEATAIRLLANQNILQSLLLSVHKTGQISLIRAESAKERIWQELEEALAECKTSGDMTNRLRVIELMGKFHQLWSDKVTISVESYEKMTSEHLAELRELSKLRLLGNGPITEALLNAPRLIESDDNSGPDNQGGIDSTLLQCPSMPFTEQESIQDAVGDDDNDNNTSMDKVHNDTQVLDNKEVM
jgi:phage terminase small subunit